MDAPPSEGSQRDAIVQIEAARRAAMVGGDVDALERMIAPDALYVHTNGLVELGSEFLATLRSGAYHYVSVSQPEMHIRLLEDTALVTGRTILQVQLANGTMKVVDGRSVVAWTRRADGWRMLHYQGTSVPA